MNMFNDDFGVNQSFLYFLLGLLLTHNHSQTKQPHTHPLCDSEYEMMCS